MSSDNVLLCCLEFNASRSSETSQLLFGLSYSQLQRQVMNEGSFRVFDSGGSSVCYDELGCFNRTGPFVDLPLPKSPEDVGIEFLLYTPEDIEKGHVISTKNIPYVHQSNSMIICFNTHAHAHAHARSNTQVHAHSGPCTQGK